MQYHTLEVVAMTSMNLGQHAQQKCVYRSKLYHTAKQTDEKGTVRH